MNREVYVLVRDDDVVRLQLCDHVLDENRCGLLLAHVVALRVPEAEEVGQRDGDRRLACNT